MAAKRKFKVPAVPVIVIPEVHLITDPTEMRITVDPTPEDVDTFVEKTTLQKLETRWTSFTNRLKADTAAAKGVFDKLVKAYDNTTTRMYHSLTHIEACLNVMDAHVPKDSKITPYVEMAIWFHDIIIDHDRKDSEVESAFAFMACGREMGLKGKFIGDVADMIPYTMLKWHTKEAPHPRYDYLRDVYLSVLGADEKTFKAYELGIRYEYSYIPTATYNRARAFILDSFLKRDRIYNTEIFRNLYETKARENITRSIAFLGGN